MPDEFKVKLLELHGQKGEDWLEALPQLLDRCASRFGVTFKAAFANLSWNLLLVATQQDGTTVVLKIIVLKSETSRELGVLRAYAGRGAVRVMDADDDLGVLMLERVEPGTPLSEIEDDNLATEIFCTVLKRLHCPPPTDQYPSMKEFFAAIERYCTRFSGGAGPLPTKWVQRANECLAFLISSTRDTVLLHGDLHHDNILRRGDGDWAVIDPKGIVGDPHFDAIQYLLNYEDRSGDPDTVLQHRIGLISKRLDLDAKRIAMWGVARGVLNACWDVEDGRPGWNEGILTSKRFAKYLGRHWL